MVSAVRRITQLCVPPRVMFIRGVLAQVHFLLSLSFYFPCSNTLRTGGRLGYGDETHYLAPVMLSLNKVIIVACSISHSGFITSEGRILSTSPLPPSHSKFFESLKVYICVERMNSGN